MPLPPKRRGYSRPCGPEGPLSDVDSCVEIAVKDSSANAAPVGPVFALRRLLVASAARPAGVPGVDLDELPAGPCCLVAELADDDPPGPGQNLAVQAALGRNVLARCSSTVPAAERVMFPISSGLDSDAPEAAHDVRGDQVAFIPVAHCLTASQACQLPVELPLPPATLPGQRAMACCRGATDGWLWPWTISPVLSARRLLTPRSMPTA